MDQKIEIKQEPVWLEGAASTSFENCEFESANSHIKEETKPEYTESGPTQPGADIKDEITIEEQTVDQLVPFLKEEDRSVESPYLHDIAAPRIPQLHTSVHTCIRPYACDQCCKTFFYKSSLMWHITTHTKAGSHYCVQCGKAFHSKAKLKQHAVLHIGDVPFVCNQCGKAFSRETLLKKHTLTHNGMSPHVCSQCQKTFYDKRGLEQHRVMHTGRRPYECVHCDKAFWHKSSLKQHTLSHPGAEYRAASQC